MIYFVVCLLVIGSENETTDEQPTENRHLDMNRDDYAKLHVILDCSPMYTVACMDSLCYPIQTSFPRNV